MALLVDLFCGAGGASAGYARAGFEVVGVDIRPQPRYPFRFIRADALAFPLEGFDAVHASPPCQHWSGAVPIARRAHHPDLLEAVRERLLGSGLPYVIENVPGAPLRDPVRLCGSAFDLGVKRHRLFESDRLILGQPCRHRAYPPQHPAAHNRTTPLRFVNASGGWGEHPDRATVGAAMGIDWMTRDELSQAIPPAYTEYIGLQLMVGIPHGIDSGAAAV